MDNGEYFWRFSVLVLAAMAAIGSSPTIWLSIVMGAVALGGLLALNAWAVARHVIITSHRKTSQEYDAVHH